MNVKEAARRAAQYVVGLESLADGSVQEESDDEALRNMHFAIEGTHYDEEGDRWKIDVGFARPWDKANASPLAGLSGAAVRDNRTFKTVTIDNVTGEVLAYGNN